MYNFKHFLVFSFGRVEVLEPIGFDASNFVCEQDSKKFGRDTFYGSDEISLRFTTEKGKPIEPTRILDNGMILSHITSGLELLIDEDKRLGAESKVLYELEKDNVIITTGQLDFTNRKTDYETFFECKIVQQSEQANIKRVYDSSVDLFSVKDLKDNDITPVRTYKMLLQAKPITRLSKWTQSRRQFAIGSPPNMVALGAGFRYFNPCQGVEKYGIENTLSNLDTVFGFSTIAQKARFIQAEYTLTDLKITFDSQIVHHHRFNDRSDPFGNPSQSSFGIYIGKSSDGVNVSQTQEIYFNETTVDFAVDTPVTGVISTTVNFPVYQGEFLCIWFISNVTLRASSTDYNNTAISSFLTFSKCDISLTATGTAQDSVIDCIKYIDLIKQTYKAAGIQLPVIAKKFDVGGEFENQYCFNGNLIRQFIEKPFYSSIKEVNEHLMEVSADSQNCKDKVYIGQYTDYYTNVDLGGFLQVPDKDFSIENNEKVLINQFNFEYSKYEKDRDEKNTLDAIHTEANFFVQAENSINKKEIKLPYVRDPYKIETARRRANETDNTAESTDNEIMIADAVGLAPNSRRTLIARLQYTSILGGDVQVFSDGSFNWTILGFRVGDTVILNTIQVVVTNISSTVLTVTSGTATQQGVDIITLDYPITTATLTNRTNQGLIFSQNLLNPDNFSNLRYSIKRNMIHWFPYLASCSKFISGKKIKKNKFIANGECVTQFTGEPNYVKENADILVNDISNYKILSQNIINTTIIVKFEQVKELIDNIQNINEDGSIGGFIRILANNGRVVKGYIQKLDHNWKTNEMKITLEERNESDYLIVDYNGTNLTINEVGYDAKTVTERRFKVFNDKIQFFDENNIPLCNSTFYNLVLFNGVQYGTVEELVSAILG